MQSAGSSTFTVPLSVAITGLSPSTIYRYQLVTTNSSGTTYGLDQTFTTALDPATANVRIAKIWDRHSSQRPFSSRI